MDESVLEAIGNDRVFFVGYILSICNSRIVVMEDKIAFVNKKLSQSANKKVSQF